MQQFKARAFSLYLFLACASVFNYSLLNAKNQTWGWVEHGVLTDYNLVLPIKMDTGANSSSLDARDLQIIHKNNKSYAKFNIPSPSTNYKTITLPIVSYTKIKKRNAEKTTELRPVVQLKLTLANHTEVLNVSLTSRQNFDYRMILGRDALSKFNASIDSSKTYIAH